VRVALEACKFWLTFAEDVDVVPFLHPLLTHVAPVLPDCMVYGEDDLLCSKATQTYLIRSRTSSLATTAKFHGLERDNPVNTSAPSNLTSRSCIGTYGKETLDVDDDDFDFDFDDLAEEMSIEWNLRKCAAAPLDVLAVRFGGDLLVVLLDPLKENLWSADAVGRSLENPVLPTPSAGDRVILAPYRSMQPTQPRRRFKFC
jgi:transportin-1